MTRERTAFRWSTPAVDPRMAGSLAADLALPLPLAVALVARGLERADEVTRFLNPRLSDLSDPFLIAGMETAVRRIWEAIERGERVAVFGDYDADGVTATALVVSVLKSLGVPVAAFLPDRRDDGYGLTTPALERCLAAHRPNLLVTVDCGTNSVAAVNRAREAGVDTVVTDHHEPSGEAAPAVAVVNPRLGAPVQARDLAGVGVAFKLCHAIVKQGLSSDARRARVGDLDLREWLDVVAVGTVTDIVPLVGENRILVRHGIERLNATRRPGLSELIRVAGIRQALDAYHIGFVLGPRLNAAGRMGSAEAALDLLLTTEPGRARDLAEELDRSNSARKAAEDAIVRDADGELQARFDPARDFGIVVGRKGWHVGTIGIVASRLAQRYNRPAVVVGLEADGGVGRGSCRSAAGVDMLAVLSRCSGHLTAFGGHKMAAGLSIEGSRLGAFREAFCRECAAALEGRDLRPVLDVDAWIDLGGADARLLEATERLGPFGLGNRRPVWAVRGVSAVGPPRTMAQKHVRLTLGSGGRTAPAVGFNMADRPLPEGSMDVAFEVRANDYRGSRDIELHLRDFRAQSD